MWQFCLALAIASSRSVIAFPQNDGLAGGKVEIQTIPSTFSVDGFVFDGPADGRNVATTATTTSSATPSTTTEDASFDSRYNRCIATCLTTSEYNPVCGSDDVEYSNPGQLSCASACGKDVTLTHYGKCRTTKIRG
ncbi:uncharacterized protein LOC117209832 [Bombus bifarius]|uniref:Uncharacterized protein LOC117209832 n=1 Tax=Bombus bifarius TaxID=103933 RepID=A0A6P8MF44_9HYME|nr:uncharacterized protein LOC117166199 [Bombus vancouverensis nearcticus]XP_033308144.1 uncharacterized protein LOC117209832 [Bombus bifarius]